MPSEPPASLDSIKTTVVVGGGLAGISAALALARHGVQVTLLESRRKLGGRTGSFARVAPESGLSETIDYCQHVGMGCCTNLKQLINWLGQDDHWHEHRQLHFFGPTGEYQRLSAWPLLPAPLHLTGWLLQWPGLKYRDRISIARGMLAIRQVSLANSTGQSAVEWLKAHGQTTTAIDHFWGTILVSALGERLELVSLSAMAKVLQDGFLNHRQAFHLLVPQCPLGELFGERALEVLLAQGVDVRLQSPVDQLDLSEQHLPSVRSAAATYRADAMVVAVPWHQLGKISLNSNSLNRNSLSQSPCQLHSAWRKAGKLQSSSITGIHTWWDQPWMPLPHAAIVGRLCQWIFPDPKASIRPTLQLPAPSLSSSTTSAAAPMPTIDHYYQIVISATHPMRQVGAKQLVDQVQADLCDIFPAARQAKLLRSQVVTDPQAVFSISPEVDPLRPEARLNARCMLAGDWTATGWPATMEGAILSGFRAAENLLGLGRSTPPTIVAPPLR